jgi:hypothetical protein
VRVGTSASRLYMLSASSTRTAIVSDPSRRPRPHSLVARGLGSPAASLGRSLGTTTGIRQTESRSRDVPEATERVLPDSLDLLELYRDTVARGKLKWDDEQVRCVMKVSRIAGDASATSDLSDEGMTGTLGARRVRR